MARRINVTETATATGATYAVTLGAHVDGDVLAVCLTQNDGTLPISLGKDSVTVSSDSGAKFTYATGANDFWDDGEQIILTGIMPGGFTTGRRYFIRELNPTTNTFYLETSVGAGRIAYSSAGASVVAHRMTGGASANNNCAGWKIVGASSDTTVVAQAAFADSREVWAYRIVGTGEAPIATPTFTGTTDYWLGTCVVLREVDTTAEILWQRSNWGGTNAGIPTGTSNSVAASSAGGTTIITAPTDALLLYSWSADGGAFMRCKSDELIAISKPTPGFAAHIIGYRQHGASGNPADVTMYATALTEGGNGWVLAFANATGGNLEKDCRSGITEVDWFGDFRLAKGALCTIAGNPGAATITYTAPTTDRWLDGQGVSFINGGTLPTGIVQGTPYYIINATPGSNTFQISATLGGSAITISTAGSGTHQIQQSFTAPNDVVSSINSISTHTAPPTVVQFSYPSTPWGSANTLTNATANVWGGGTWKIPATDMSGGIVALQWSVDVSPTAAAAGAEGALVLFSDGTNWAAFQLSTRALYSNGEVQQAFIDLDNGTTYATSGTLNTAAITHVVPLVHRITTGSFAIFVKNLFVMRTATLTGGGEDFPTDFVTLFDALNSWGSLRLASKQGSAQILGKANIQIGDGTNKLYWDTSGASFEYPIAWSTTDATAKDWNGATDSVSLTIKAASGNTINLSSGGITTSVPQSVTIDAASSASATYSIAGQSFKGLSAFTDNAGIVLASPTYKECGTVSLKANMTGMSVSKTVGAVPAVAMTANNKTLTSCTTDVTGTSATYHLELSTAVDAITLADHTFTGSAATNKVHVLKTTGTVTITISGTTVLDSGGVTSEGATIVVSAPTVTADISITGMLNTTGANNRLQIINTTAVSAASRANSTAYSAGDIRLRQTGIGSENTAGLYLRCTTSGTSAGSPPAWNTTPGGTTTDGTVVWTTYKVLYYDADPAATSLSDTYIDGEEFKAGEVVEIRFAEEDPGVSFNTYSTSVVAATTGFSALVNETADDVYATYALSGATYDTTFSPNYTSNYIVLDTNTNFSGASAFAYYCYLLTTSDGMYRFWGGLTALDTGNIRNNTATISLYFDESAGFVRQTDDVRIFRDDGTRPAIDPTTGGAGIEINWRTPVNVVSTGGSALTPTESAQLMALPSASTTASAVGARTVEGTYSEDEILRLIAAALAGSRAGIGTATETYTGLDGATVRISLTPDANGNGTPVLDAT